MSFKLRRVVLSIIVALAIIIPTTLQSNQRPSDGSLKVYSKWEWHGASIKSVIEHISLVSGVTIVLDPKVDEKVSLTLRDKSWEDAFKVVCQMNALRYDDMGGYIYVMKEDDFIKKQIKLSQDQDRLEKNEKTKRIMVKLENTTAMDMIQPVNGILSKSGKVTPVSHTNSLIIEDLERNLEEVQDFIVKMDKEVLQISISAKIIEVSSGTQNDIGIQWSFFDKSTGGQVTHLPNADDGVGITGSNVIGAALEKATYGILDEQGFAIALEYLYAETESEVVAEPQITTLENKLANIFMGSKIPYSRLDESGNTVLEQLDARTELSVLPYITGNGQIAMELTPIKKSYELTTDGPIIHEQGAKTNVVVRDGETIVIGGLTSDDDLTAEGGIPILKDIPIIGFLFKRSSKRISKKDLVIFVTPHIIKSTLLDVMLESDKVDEPISTEDDYSVINEEVEAESGFIIE
jgi:type IV pilus assembly protein PilQ